MSSYLFTSESVSEGHPDKMCDQISDAVLDACCMEQSPPKVGHHSARKILAETIGKRSPNLSGNRASYPSDVTIVWLPMLTFTSSPMAVALSSSENLITATLSW